MEPVSHPDGAPNADKPTQSAPESGQIDITQFKQRLQALSAKVDAIEQLEAAEQLPPEEAAQMLEQLVEMEAVIREGLDGIFSPSVFWQAVRWGGLGIVLGALLQRWAGCGF
ncbi:MAG: hypothetical protein AB4050_12985 [Synechococcus sp.]